MTEHQKAAIRKAERALEAAKAGKLARIEVAYEPQIEGGYLWESWRAEGPGVMQADELFVPFATA